MYFGIRGKVALLVMVATAASALLVAQFLSRKAEAVLRDHELVDLGDEASLRAWETIDQIEGLRDDITAVSNSDEFAAALRNGASPEALSDVARSLCKRFWRSQLKVEVISFADSGSETMTLRSGASIKQGEEWFPGPEAGPRVRLSPIQRLLLERFDLPGMESVVRWEPVIWAVAPLSGAESNDAFVRFMMVLDLTESPRHFFVLENHQGEQLVRYDENSESGANNEIFRALNQDPDLQRALGIARARADDPERNKKLVVQRLKRRDLVPLNEFYYFQEALPKEQLREALQNEDTTLEEFSETLSLSAANLGVLGGITNSAGEIRLLAPSTENLGKLREATESALTLRYGEEFDGLDWRAEVVCDEISVWTVRLLIGPDIKTDEYFIHYAVLDDELASSIAYEMLSLQTIALLVAAAFGIVGFFMAMHFIRPLKQMTGTAQKITASNRDKFHQRVADLARDLDTKRQDEVGDIARASKRLFEELVSFQEELEQRVNDRTRELRRANTELEKAYEKLMTLSHEKDAFVAKVSHDLRQPLNAIFLQVEALRLSELDELQRQDVDRIHAHAARELNLVNDILEYQKIIMGAETLSKDSIDITNLLSDLEEAFAPDARAKGLTFTQAPGEADMSITADDRRVRQVLGNLVGNSVKFTKEGSITLEARPREINETPWVEFTISDTGRGMSPEEQSKAFVPFVSNKKDNAGGSGLGLSICKELVSQMGGRIGFVSELGKGTHFSVFLPCEPTAEQYERKDDSQPLPAGFSPTSSGESSSPISRDATVLVIDDDPKVRELLSRLLSAEGYGVLSATDGASGLAMAEEHQPDAITLDVVMPGEMDGWEVLNRLKDSEETQSIPVVMVSVMAEQDNGGALDVEDYLVKPIDMNRLSRVIQRVTGQSLSQSLLLVDDDEDALDTMGRILEDAGWKTIKATDGAEALAMLEKSRPAAIVLDLLMPGMDGFEFLEKLQDSEHLKSIPVIVLSGKDPSEEEQTFLRERVMTVLKKGHNAADELIHSINARIRSRE